MNTVVQAVRERYPQYSEVGDDELTKLIGERYPSYLDVEDFKTDFERVTTPPSLRPTLESPDRVMQSGRVPDPAREMQEISHGPLPKEPEPTVSADDSNLIEADLLTKRYKIAMDLTQDPTKRGRLHEEYLRKMRRTGVLAVEEKGAVEASLSPLVHLPRAEPSDLERLGMPIPTSAKVGRGVINATAGIAESLTSPAAIGTLGLGAVAPKTAKVVAGAFAADMAKNAVVQGGEFIEAVKAGDVERATQTGIETVATGYFAKKSAEHANAPLKSKSEMLIDRNPEARGALEELVAQVERGEMEPILEVAREAELAQMPRTAEALKDLVGQPDLIEGGAKSKEVGKYGETPKEKVKEVLVAEKPVVDTIIAGERSVSESGGRAALAEPDVLAERGAGTDPSLPAPEISRPAPEVVKEPARPGTAEPLAFDAEVELTRPENLRQIEAALQRQNIPPSEMGDAVQSVIERALEREVSGKGFDSTKGAKPGTYLYQLARSYAVDWHRTRTAQKRGGGEETRSLDEALPDSDETLGDITQGEAVKPGNALALAERGRIVQEAVSTLPEGEKSLVEAFLRGEIGEKELKPSVRAKLRGILEGKITAEQAVLRTAQSVDDLIKDFVEYNMGVRPPGMGMVKPAPLKLPSALSSDLPAVETRWKGARIEKVPIWQRAKAKTVELYQSFRRHFPKLDPDRDGRVMDDLRQFEATPVYSKELAGQALKGITAGFDRQRLDVFERVVVLRDLLRDVEAGHYQGKELPFGYPDQAAIKTDLTKFEAIASGDLALSNGLKARTAMWEGIRGQMVDKGLLPESVLERPDYFHRQVLLYLRAKEFQGTGTSSTDVRTHRKGFQIERTHSSKDYNTAYLEAEFEVLSQAFAQLRTVEMLEKIRSYADVSESLKALAKEQGVEWQTLLPADHTVWQPRKGNVFYWTNSLTEKVLQQVLDGSKLLTDADVGQALAIGGKRAEWAIPRRLAETLDDLKPPVDNSAIAQMSAGIMGRWKQWTLLMPLRALKYNLNNMSGDLDIVLAWRPGILKYMHEAQAEAFAHRVRGKAPTAEQLEAIKKGIIGSDFYVQEIPDISRHDFLRFISGERPNLIQRYWGNVTRWTQWREDILRLATYKYAKEHLAKGEKLYGASRRVEVDAIPDLNDRAAKIARELIGDYGNISRSGQWMRRHMIPFYSWMEINAPRYYRLFRNLQAEDAKLAGASRLTGMVAVRAAKTGTKFALKAAMMYSLVHLWNKTFFAEEERELGDMRRQLHLILGRNEDGTIRSIRFQGALSDALDWFGLSDFPDDMQDLAEGQTSLKKLAMEAGLSPVNKIVNTSLPLAKTGIEAVAGKSVFPEALTVRQNREGLTVASGAREIRDRGEHVAKLFSLGSVYKWLAGRPSQPMKRELSQLLTYTTDPGEAAYYAARSIVAEKRMADGKDDPAKTQALYFYRQALRFKDPKLADKWKSRYMELGGTERGLNQSVTNADPLHGIPANQRQMFLQQLTDEERAIMEKAGEYYRKVYK